MGHCLGEARTHKNSHCSGGKNPTALFQAAHEKATFSQLAESGNLNGSGVAGQPAPPAFPPLTEGLRGARHTNNTKCHGKMTSRGPVHLAPDLLRMQGTPTTGTEIPEAPSPPQSLAHCCPRLFHDGGGGSEGDKGEQCIQCDLN